MGAQMTHNRSHNQAGKYQHHSSNNLKTTDMSGVFSTDTDYHGNIKLSAIESSATSLLDSIGRYGDDIGVVYDGDQHGLSVHSRWFLTPGGEIVYTTPKSESTVLVAFPQRDCLNENGDAVLYSYVTDTTSLLSRMDADGGWKYFRPYEYVEQPRCPDCNGFLKERFNGDGIPETECTRQSCDGWVTIDELVNEGSVENIY